MKAIKTKPIVPRTFATISSTIQDASLVQVHSCVRKTHEYISFNQIKISGKTQGEVMEKSVVNVVGKMKAGFSINLEELFNRESKVVSETNAVKFDPSRFPAVQYKQTSKNGNLSFLIFRNGSVTVSGCKSEKQFNSECDGIMALLQKYRTDKTEA